MSRFRSIAALVLVVVLAAVAVRLGFWQLDRLATRRANNTVLLAARAADTLELGREAPEIGRGATARGSFDTAGEVILRNRVHRSAPGVHVVTPFRLADSDATIWVLRGFVPAADGVRPASVPAPESGVVSITGQLQPLPHTRNGGQLAVTGGDTTWQRLDADVAQQRRPGSAAMVLYLAGGEAGPGGLAAVEPPTLDNGPHLSYAIQWFAIAAAILAFGVWVIRKPAARDRARSPRAP